MLAGIHRASVEYLAECEEDYRLWKQHNVTLGRPGVELGDTRTYGMPIAFDRFLGYYPTPSERIRAQEAMRGLEAQGLLKVYGLRATRVKLTEAGLAKLKELGATDGPATE